MSEETVYATFYFGEPVEGAELDGLFEADGKYYYYMVEVLVDDFRITDSCGRMVPFDKTSLKEFNLAVFGVTQTYAALDAANNLYDKKIAELNQVLDFYEERL